MIIFVIAVSACPEGQHQCLLQSRREMSMLCCTSSTCISSSTCCPFSTSTTSSTSCLSTSWILRFGSAQMKEKHSRLLRQHHEYFHKVWGCLLKSGYQNSRYAHQIERFACLYASHVSNLSFYSPDKAWRADSDGMVHENMLPKAETWVEFAANPSGSNGADGSAATA
eukprot:jgi/Botrbrau1/21527/Bobra.174_2s0030.1